MQYKIFKIKSTSETIRKMADQQGLILGEPLNLPLYFEQKLVAAGKIKLFLYDRQKYYISNSFLQKVSSSIDGLQEINDTELFEIFAASAANFNLALSKVIEFYITGYKSLFRIHITANQTHFLSCSFYKAYTHVFLCNGCATAENFIKLCNASGISSKLSSDQKVVALSVLKSFVKNKIAITAMSSNNNTLYISIALINQLSQLFHEQGPATVAEFSAICKLASPNNQGAAHLLEEHLPIVSQVTLNRLVEAKEAKQVFLNKDPNSYSTLYISTKNQGNLQRVEISL